MKTAPSICHGLGLTLLALVVAGLGPKATAETVSTVPVGAITYSIPANATRAITLPLLDSPAGSGQMTGKITSVSENKIINSGAGWTVSALSSANNPYYVRIVSGVAAGRIFLVSTAVANTATELTLINDGIDLTTLNIVSGVDAYEIVPLDTLGSFFGSSTLQGGVSPSTADNVYVWNTSSFLKFYYNTLRNRWERDVDSASSPSRDGYVLRPDRGIMIQRNASTALAFTVVGRVQSGDFQVVHNTNGTSFLNYGFPVAVNLINLGLHNQSGWRKWNDPMTAAANADLIQIWNSSSWLTFYYDSNSNHWQRAGEIAGNNRDTYSVSPAAPIVVRRLTGDAVKTIKFSLPYSL